MRVYFPRRVYRRSGSRHVNVCAVFDNEEVGSLSKQGADSTLLGDVLNRALASLGLSDTQIRAALASSFMVSADNAHAVHPNHPEKYDELNRTFMNGGVVIKHNANQKYTTDAVSDAIFAEICAKAACPWRISPTVRMFSAARRWAILPTRMSR